MGVPRIVVVEDERIVAYHLRQRLTRLGYLVAGVAASGRQALQQIRELHPDVVLMDIKIEGEMDGIETVGRIPPEDRPAVIFLTAYGERATLERARAVGPSGYLTKPFSEPELDATIRTALGRPRA
jgi:CheY-like chemotaxis protein